ncbi:hypothetical protein J2X16_004238 [Pelomonas aquatica]|uniref:Uncharacterized protein n=1 Tax=Pelomonas aquatica TaxID=431058 RepID=A0ABU1ZE14_9BURK|nr:hypothetical protein [Pelomonas aquatica]MDR7298870.1 hypothetical protein [Pelomonas aquatica]
MKRRFALAGLFVFANIAVAEPIDVSLINLIATPADFDGKQVRVKGFARVEFEGNAIYLHRDDYLYGITKNGIWLDLEKASNKSAASADKRYVLIEGVFSMKEQGHFGMWSGSIKHITRIQPWLARR